MSQTRVVLITGASSGIGRATARAFARQGADLVLAARSAKSLAETAADCLADGGTAITVPTDVGSASAVDDLFAAAERRFGRIDVVVNSAAAVGYGRFEDVPADVFDRVMTTNITGTANVARTALRYFRAAGSGDLILVGSLLGKIAVPYMSPYVTSKWAVHGLARILQIEARETPGINISVVSPGSVNTPAYAQAANYSGWQGRPPPPVDPPEKVARAILRAVDNPQRDRSVGVLNGFQILGFRLLPGVYDLLVTPLVKVVALSRKQIEPGPYSAFEPLPGGDAEYGEWGRHWLRGIAAAALTGAAAGTAVLRGWRRR